MKFINPLILASVSLIVVSLILALFDIYARYSPYYFLALGIAITLHFIEEIKTQFWVAPAEEPTPFFHNLSNTQRTIDRPAFITNTATFNLIMWVCIIFNFLNYPFFANIGEGLALFGVISMFAHIVPAIKKWGYFSGVISAVLTGIVGLILILATIFQF